MNAKVKVMSYKPSTVQKSRTRNMLLPKLRKEVEQNTESSSSEDVTETENNLASPNSKWHDSCTKSYEEKKMKKKEKTKKTKKGSEEVIRFVEERRPVPPGATFRRTDCTKSVSSETKRKNAKYNTQIRFLEHKFVQCNIGKENEEEVEVSLPEEIKPLLINITFLLHELKQRPESKTNDELCNLISKIVTLLTELSRRPIKEFNKGVDQPKPFDEIAEKLGKLLEERIGTNNKEYENLVKDIKLLEQKLAQRDSDVNYVKEQIVEERSRLMSNSNELNDSLRNSTLKNLSLKAEIKFNRALFKKYSKIMAQKEQIKQKSDLELSNLRRKYAKQEYISQVGTKSISLRPSNPDNEVSHGGSLTKYIKSKVTTDKKIKRKVTKN